jgi:hypothetical protein
MKKCNELHPCPLHDSIQPYKKDLLELLLKTDIGSLITDENPDFVKAISAA